MRRYQAESSHPGEKKTMRKTLRWILASAACLVLLCACAVIYAVRYGYFNSVEMVVGTIMEETYYFTIPHKGLYAYTPDGSLQRVLKTPEYSSWLAGEGRLFYIAKRHIYMLCDGVKTEVLDLSPYNGLGYELRSIEQNVLTFSYLDSEEAASGDADERLVCVDWSTGSAAAAGTYAYQVQNSFELGEIVASTEEYIYYVANRASEASTLYCYSKEDEEAWSLCDAIGVYAAETDGTWFYTCTPWSGGTTACWEIIYDDGQRPSALKLIDADITKN